MSAANPDAGVVLRRVQVQSIELHWTERGCGEPVVLLHGGTGDCRSWILHLERFGERYRALAYSRRYSFPNRNAEPAGNYSALADAGDLAGLLDALAVDAAHLVGASYGALVALAFAVGMPGRVRSLALFEPPLAPWISTADPGRAACDDFHRSVWDPAAAAFRAGRAHVAMQLLVDGFAGRPVFRALATGELERLLQNANAMRALTLSSDPFPDLSRAVVRSLPVPVLIGCGEETTTIHRLGIDALRRELPGAKYVSIAGAGHRAPLEQAHIFTSEVLGWLETLAR